MVGVADPIYIDLTTQFLPCKVDLSQTPDADGFYFRPGDTVELYENERVRKLTAGGKLFGIVKLGITTRDTAFAPLDDTFRIMVMPVRFNRAVVNQIAAEALAAGKDVMPNAELPSMLSPTATDAPGSGVCFSGATAKGQIVRILI